ncbi:MAG TPA: hypothetical protein VFE62_17455 [Gemmataceae bacterium]|nr:hypothetical protein [Gemmataceae bacterium]
MASAATKISFTCPNCAKVLRANSRPPAGKKIKCPACGEAFLPELDEDEEATAIQSTPSKIKAKTPARDEDDEDAKSRNKKKRADEDDEDDDGPPRRKNRRDDDDEDEERPSKKKKKQKSGSRGLLIGLSIFLLGGGALLSCGMCGVGAFVWPGFLTSKKSNLEAFVPPDANLVMGGNPKLFKAKAAELEKVLRFQGFPQAGMKREDIEMNSDQLLMFGNTSDMGGNFTTVFVSTAADIDKLKRNPGLGAAQTIGGHANVHKISDEGKRNGLVFDYIAFASNNVVVGAVGDQQALVATLDRGKKSAQPNAALDLSRSVNSSHFWLALKLDNRMRDDLRRGMGQRGAMPMPPAVQAAIPAVDGIQGVTVTIDVADNQDIKIQASVPCKNADDAGKVKTAAEESFNQLKAILQLGAMFQQPGKQQIPQAFMTDLTSIQFATEGSNATAKLKLTSQAVQELAKLGANKGNFVGGPMPAPGPMPGPGPFPGPNPQPGPGPGPGPINPPGPFPGPNPQPPINDPQPDVTPPAGGKLIKTLNYANLVGGEKRFTSVSLKQGKTVTVTMESTIPQNQFADVDLYVLRGNAGEQLVTSDLSVGPNGRVSFVVPVTGIYRVRAYNRGPAIATGCLIKVYEQ